MPRNVTNHPYLSVPYIVWRTSQWIPLGIINLNEHGGRWNILLSFFPIHRRKCVPYPVPPHRNEGMCGTPTTPYGQQNLSIYTYPLTILNQLVCSNGNHESETTISVGGGDDGVFHDRHDPIPHYSPGYGRIPNDATSPPPPPPSPCKGGVQYHPLFHHDNGRENVVVASIITVS